MKFRILRLLQCSLARRRDLWEIPISSSRCQKGGESMGRHNQEVLETMSEVLRAYRTLGWL